MRTISLFSVPALFLAMPLMIGCGDTGGGGPNLDELYEQGLTRFVDDFDPENDPSPDEDGIKRFVFEVPDDPSAEPRGPLCLRGGPWAVDTRSGSSDEVLIYLQGGGACWPDFCAGTTNSDGTLGGASSGILDPENDTNPLKDHNVVYMPYCDGSVFAGDVDRMLPTDALDTTPVMSYQRGLQNLTAALDIAAKEFPNPSRVVIGGISAGGFGTITATPLARYYYPDVDILVLNDSGIGVGKSDDPAFFEGLLDGWNAGGMIPESCTDCTANGHITRLLEWTLEADPKVWLSQMSHNEDFVVATFFFMIPPAQFSADLLSETARIADNFPLRYKRFITPGTFHTYLLNPGDPSDQGFGVIVGTLKTEIDGTSLWDWVTGMINGTDDWKNLVDDSL